MQSCETFDPNENPVPTCVWNDTEIVQFSDLQLKHPTGISTYHSYLIPADKIERNLPNILYTNGDAPNSGNTAKIRVNLYSDGTSCTGNDMAEYSQNNGAEYVGGSSISEVPFPSNADFWGEVRVTITTDVYNNTSGSDTYYHIKWEEKGNNPNGGLVGIIDGEKRTHININGTQSIVVSGVNGYLYKGGVKNYF